MCFLCLIHKPDTGVVGPVEAEHSLVQLCPLLLEKHFIISAFSVWRFLLQVQFIHGVRGEKV